MDGSVTKMMKALVWLGPEKLAVKEVEKPNVGTGEALVKMTSNGICGTDITIFKGYHPRAKPPLIPGHEIVGELEAITVDAGSAERKSPKWAIGSPSVLW